jgi:arylsulfatase A-like enzyme
VKNRDHLDSFRIKTLVILGALTGASIGFIDLTFNIISFRPVPFSFFWSLFPPILIMALFSFILYVIAFLAGRIFLSRWLHNRHFPFAVSLSFFMVLFFTLITVSGLTHSLLSDIFSFYTLTILFLSLVSAIFCFVAISLLAAWRQVWISAVMSLTVFLANFFLYVWVITFVSSSLWLNILLFILFVAIVVFEIRVAFTHTFFMLYPSLLFLFFILFSAISFSQSQEFRRVDGNNSLQPPVKYIILLTVDTLRPDFIAAYGERDNYTPNMDQIARDGIVFENAYSASPWTLPSVASIMTGLPPSVHMTKTATSKLPDTLSTLAELLRKKGYKTAAIGNNQFLTPFYNISQGFDEYYFYPKARFGETIGMKILGFFVKDIKIDVTSAELTDLIIRWLRKDSLNPLFLWIHYFDPHMPYTAPQRFLPNVEPAHGLGLQFYDLAGVRRGYFYPDQKQSAWIAELYAAEVRYVDDCIGSLVKQLKELGIYDQSLLVFSSDHGEEFWEHGGFEHGHTIYNEQIRIPLIIKLPNSSPALNEQVQTPVSLLSLFPTILDYAGIDQRPVGADDESLRPFLSAAALDKSDMPIFSEALKYYEDQESVIMNRHKCIHYLAREIYELYDLESDPEEMHSLADSRPELINLAKEKLQSFHQHCDSIKAAYGIEKGENLILDKSAIESLRSLGYIR